MNWGIIAGTNSRFSDTDDDGLNGGYEVETRTDFSVPDSWDEGRLEGNPITNDAPPVLSASVFNLFLFIVTAVFFFIRFLFIRGGTKR